MSTASIAAANVYLAMQQMDGPVNEAFMTSIEPYRAAMDASRELGLHSIEDGTDDFYHCITCLEVLVCD